MDKYKPEKYLENAVFRPESSKAYKDLVDQGWTDPITNLYPKDRVYAFWDYMRDAYCRNPGLRLDHFLLNRKIARQLADAGENKHVQGWKVPVTCT